MATAFVYSDISYKARKTHNPTKKPGRNILYFKTVILDFDQIAADKGVALAASDTFEVFEMEAGETILLAGIQNLTATTAAATANLGFTGGTTDFLIQAHALNTVTLPGATTCLDSPVYFAAADKIDMLINAQAAAGGVCKVWALCSKI